MTGLTPEAILGRWERIRANPECELSLEPEAVASFLRKPESEIVKNRIQEALVDLSRYRLKKGRFESENPAGAGDLATCEGLETFLVPAVEEALPFSALLKMLPEGQRNEFVGALVSDINNLVKAWSGNVFSAAPYGNLTALRNALRPDLKEELGEINNTEAAAFACRVLVHLLILLTRGTREEQLFVETIGAQLNIAQLLLSLKNAIAYLVESFQKQEGEDERQRIVGAKVDGKPGSGWSWTARQGLPPMLFFTASAVDAFAELDLYLIRPMVKRAWPLEGIHGELAKFYVENKASLDSLQLCVDMARRWIDGSILPWLSRGTGQYLGNLPLDPKPYATESPSYEGDFKVRSEQIEKAYKLKDPPIIYYNNVYALLVLLWSYADWDASGEAVNPTAKAAIDRALTQIVRRYSIPEIHDFLNRFPNVFYLPGEQLFVEGRKARCEYLDSAFLPLLTRLLVLFVVYGVGDRNLLEPVIRNLYVELLQGRDRSGDFSGLWSEASIELYSTQRAVQALTFYYAYARGRELLLSSSDQASGLLFRNTTGLDLIFEARLLSPVLHREVSSGGQEHDGDPEPDPPTQEEFVEKTKEGFLAFCRELPGHKDPKLLGLDPEKDKQVLEFLERVDKFGKAVIDDVREGRIEKVKDAESLLRSLCGLLSSYDTKDSEKAFNRLQKRHEALLRG